MRLLGTLCALFVCTSCSNRAIEPAPKATTEWSRSNFGSLFGSDRLVLQRKKLRTERKVAGPLTVNKFLWQAALETLSFMTVKSAQPQNGRIVTEWYTDPNYPSKRVRVAVIIRGPELRADALKVYVERLVLNGRKQWVDAPLTDRDITNLEVLMVDKARKIKRQFQEQHHLQRQKIHE